MKSQGKLQELQSRFKEYKDKAKEFLQEFQDFSLVNEDDLYRKYGQRKYLVMMQRVANDQTNDIQILVDDLYDFYGKEEEREMIQSIVTNVSYFVRLFQEVIHTMMPKPNKDLSEIDQFLKDNEEVLNNQRLANLEETEGRLKQPNQMLPLELIKKWYVHIVFGPSTKREIHSIRGLDSQLIGSLVECKAIVVKTSDVKPMVAIATYTCDFCGNEIYQPVDSYIKNEFVPPDKCPTPKCKENKANGKLVFIPNFSKFIPFQTLKIQQTSDQLIEGSIPRTFIVHVKGDLVRQASPGDLVQIQGVLTIKKRPGFKHQTENIFNCVIEAHKITREKKKYMDSTAVTPKIRQQIEKIRGETTDEYLFTKLARSICPEIYGMENVKKALLLLMVGGITRETEDHLRIRGEINIALIGDPGIAKSQLLKHISYLSPRGIYTTGKGSSGVGLTASIIKDPLTNEVSLEAGALVLADMGVCCIDQFDKMDENDRTAIHEVMEQQTVSIAKAGITTSLNARTSILAAANPLFGRYNKSETPHKNINLPAALLSRFDLVYILLDNPQREKDMQLAKHIGEVHQKRTTSTVDVFSGQFLRNYISQAKTYQPIIDQDLHEELVKRYVDKRKEQADSTKEGYSYTTTRTLLGLVRLCQARARLRFSNQVTSEDVQECLELIEDSQANIRSHGGPRKPKGDMKTQIFQIIKTICSYSNGNKSSYELIERRVLAKGYLKEKLDETIRDYESMNVLLRDGDNIVVTDNVSSS